jgi:hypothetical protein
MDPKKLRKQYMQVVPKLKHAMQYVQSQLSDLPPSDFELQTNIKPYPSVKRKMEADRVKDPAELSDLVRGRLFFSPQFQHEDVLDILHQLFGKKVAKIDKHMDRSTEHGLEYHGIVHLDLDCDGVHFELQLMPQEFKPFKEFLHQIYDKFRNPKSLDKLSDKQKTFLRKTHNNLYKKINQQAHTNRASDL